jgi:hypothetical protein
MTYGCGHIDAYDNGNGSITLEWGVFPGTAPTSYNVYVNGVLNQNVTSRIATVTGLTQTTYSNSTISAPSGNSARPQNMPPVGAVTPASTYIFQITAVIAGVEVAQSKTRIGTPAPFSIMLTTPMKRPFPYPNTGSPDG